MEDASTTAKLRPNATPGALVQPAGDAAWRLEIPAGPRKQYRVAQLDDYGDRPRSQFCWQPPFRLSLEARASAEVISGTWGFGLWNNPFGMAILTGVEVLRLPALPNTAWFFYASPPNYLSLRDDLPAKGWNAAVFQSPRWPGGLLALGAPLLPVLALPPAVRWLRRLGQRFVRQEAAQLTANPTGWHAYHLDWQSEGVVFQVDGETVLTSSISPSGPLGLVLWVDNQYAALPPGGKVSFGTLETPQPAWIELREVQVNGQAAH